MTAKKKPRFSRNPGFQMTNKADYLTSSMEVVMMLMYLPLPVRPLK